MSAAAAADYASSRLHLRQILVDMLPTAADTLFASVVVLIVIRGVFPTCRSIYRQYFRPATPVPPRKQWHAHWVTASIVAVIALAYYVAAGPKAAASVGHDALELLRTLSEVALENSVATALIAFGFVIACTGVPTVNLPGRHSTGSLRVRATAGSPLTPSKVRFSS